MKFARPCYRAHDPKWSASPLSGEGAAIHGGRFNAQGTPALYLSLTVDGAVHEAAQGLVRKLRPLTICLYRVDCDDLVDLRTAAGRRTADVDPAHLACAWALDLASRRQPPSWAVAQRLMASGAAGILVPSFAHLARSDMANLVLWRWGRDRPHKVEVHDPTGRLPKNQLSWDAPSS